MTLFDHMETLPITYFDTHAHGDIMSVYTNDIDTLRQMISQSIPQFINSGVTIISVFGQYADPEYSADGGLTMVMVGSHGGCARRNSAGRERQVFPGTAERIWVKSMDYIEEHDGTGRKSLRFSVTKSRESSRF